MSFAGERKAYLQAIVDAHYPTTRPSTDFSSCTTLSQLQQALQSIPSELQGSSSNPQDDANAAVQLIGLALRDLLQQGLLLQSEIDYWAQIEDHTSDQSAYLLQSVCLTPESPSVSFISGDPTLTHTHASSTMIKQLHRSVSIVWSWPS